ncbi:hypothetical protein ACHAW6_003187 [Cyclotella cf. meneghiniana]
MEMEIKTLEVDLKSWTLVELQPWMKVLPVTWSFVHKRFPNSPAKKFKAHFCTWSPGVCWSTVRLLMVLSTKLGLRFAQADIMAAFLHAHLKPVKTCTSTNHLNFIVLVTLCSPYVAVFMACGKALRYFLSTFLNVSRNKAFGNPTLIPVCDIITYFDDLLLYAFNDSDTDNLITQLKADDIWIHREGTTESFLGVKIECTYGSTSTNPTISLTQEGLTKWIIESFGLCTSYSTKKLVESLLWVLNNAIVIGMLLYLAGRSCPDIAFAVHQCA